MLEALFNLFCAYLLALLGFYIIKVIIESDKKLKVHDYLILLINCIFIIAIHYINYSIWKYNNYSPFLSNYI